MKVKIHLKSRSEFPYYIHMDSGTVIGAFRTKKAAMKELSSQFSTGRIVKRSKSEKYRW